MEPRRIPSLAARSAVLLGGALLAAGLPARTAGQPSDRPAILMVYGGSLPTPVVITTEFEDLRRVLPEARGAQRSPAAPALPGMLRLALFDGPEWRLAARDPERLRALRPAQADRHGALYPARGSTPALVWMDAQLGAVPDSGVALLRRYEVPVRVLVPR